MNATPTKPAANPDELDRLFSDFFKSQLRRPWPNAPLPATAAAPAEPSGLAATRTAEAPRNRPSPASRDNTARARFTLAASVALMFGTCWSLSNGFQPGDRPVFGPTPQRSLQRLPESDSSGDKHLPLQQLQEDKAKENDGNGGTKIEPGKLE